MATSRILSDESLKKTEEYLAQVVQLARESKSHLTNLKVRDLETVLKQIQAIRRERQVDAQFNRIGGKYGKALHDLAK